MISVILLAENSPGRFCLKDSARKLEKTSVEKSEQSVSINVENAASRH